MVVTRHKRVPPVYAELARTSVSERIETARRGLPPALVLDLAYDLRIAEDSLMLYLGLNRAAVRRKLAEQERLSPQESEGMLTLAIWLGETLAPADGDFTAQVGAAQWLGKWLRTPSAALGHRAPIQFLDVADGRGMVGVLLAKARDAAASH